MLEPGNMIRFGYVYKGCGLNDALAVYLGEDCVYREDGMIVRNFKILVVGENIPTVCDKGLKKHIRKVEA